MNDVLADLCVAVVELYDRAAGHPRCDEIGQVVERLREHVHTPEPTSREVTKSYPDVSNTSESPPAGDQNDTPTGDTPATV